MGSRDGLGADTRPTGHVRRLPGITVVSAGQAQIGRSQAQIENRIQHAGTPEIQQPSGIAGDGETRTRTGDTTIFSRAHRSGLMPRSVGVTWFPPVCGDRTMFAVCGYLSPFVGMAGASGPDLGLAHEWVASGSELEGGFAACVLGRRSPLARITLGGSARFSEKAGTNAASAPTTVSRPERERAGAARDARIRRAAVESASCHAMV
jgi:hypothetical protein